MKICKQCNAEMKDTLKFCGKCGAKFETEEITVKTEVQPQSPEVKPQAEIQPPKTEVQTQPQPPEPQTKAKKGLLLPIIAACIVGLFVFSFVNNREDKDSVVADKQATATRTEKGETTTAPENTSVTETSATAPPSSPIKDFEYKLYDNIDRRSGVHITGYIGNEKNIIIPESIDGVPVTAIGSQAFYQTNITSVTIPNSVTAIHIQAFARSGLTSITIPDSVDYIANSAFLYCTNLETVIIPNSVEKLGWGIFEGCVNLKSVTMSDNIETFERNVFPEMKDLNGTEIIYKGKTYSGPVGLREFFAITDNEPFNIFYHMHSSDVTYMTQYTDADDKEMIKQYTFSKGHDSLSGEVFIATYPDLQSRRFQDNLDYYRGTYEIDGDLQTIKINLNVHIQNDSVTNEINVSPIFKFKKLDDIIFFEKDGLREMCYASQQPTGYGYDNLNFNYRANSIPEEDSIFGGVIAGFVDVYNMYKELDPDQKALLNGFLVAGVGVLSDVGTSSSGGGSSGGNNLFIDSTPCSICGQSRNIQAWIDTHHCACPKCGKQLDGKLYCSSCKQQYVSRGGSLQKS